MGGMTDFTRHRSAFWMRVNEYDDGSLNLFVSRQVSEIVKYYFPELEQASPTGWQPGRKNPDRIEMIWVPADRAHLIGADEIKRWAQFAGGQCVWLKLGRHLEDHFNGSELDYCIAADFNFMIDESTKEWQRTMLGEAENKLKYHLHELDEEQRRHYSTEIAESILSISELLPFNNNDSDLGPIVTPIPAPIGSTKLAWALAEHVAKAKGYQFTEPHLLIKKPEMKSVKFDEKLTFWTDTYEKDDSIQLDASSIRGREVVIVDDLYQSGITMWAYSKWLKGAGAARVFGLVSVKSMRDSDNQ